MGSQATHPPVRKCVHACFESYMPCEKPCPVCLCKAQHVCGQMHPDQLQAADTPVHVYAKHAARSGSHRACGSCDERLDGQTSLVYRGAVQLAFLLIITMLQSCCCLVSLNVPDHSDARGTHAHTLTQHSVFHCPDSLCTCSTLCSQSCMCLSSIAMDLWMM